jgi:hypothetical protein
MPDIRQVTVITSNPTGNDQVGSCEVGFYTIEAGILTMTDIHGVPLRDSNTGEKITHRLMANETPRVIAKRLTLKRHRAANGDGMAGFGRRIHYPNSGFV